MTDKEKMLSLLTTQYIAKNAEWFDKISSTNDYIKDNAQNLPDGFLAATTEQYAGKGRRGHVWVSEKGQMIAFSFLLKNSYLPDLPPITLMCGLAVSKALKKLTGKKFEIKWPNDIVFEGKKICGILCESKLIGKNCFSVCGIGVNLNQTKEFFVNANIPHGTSLKIISGVSPDAASVVAEIANEFEKIYCSLTSKEKDATENFIKEYEANCVTIESYVKIVKPNSEILGVAIAVNSDGSLKVETKDGVIDVLASEASVRGVMGYS